MSDEATPDAVPVPPVMEPSAAPIAASVAETIIRTNDAAELLGVSPEWIRRLVREKWIERAKPDQYRLVDVVRGYVKYLKDEGRQTSKSAAASRVQDARAEEIGLRLDEKRGALLEQGQAEAINVIDQFVGGLKADLFAIPARVTADIALRRKIEDGIDSAFGEAGKRAAVAADRVRSAGKALRGKAKAKPRRMGKGKSDVPGQRGRPGAA